MLADAVRCFRGDPGERYIVYRKRRPQCAKSDEMTNALLGSARYGARVRPSCTSVDMDALPIMMGVSGGNVDGSSPNVLNSVSSVRSHG